MSQESLDAASLAEKILVHLAGKPLVAIRSVHLLSVQVDHVEDDVIVKKAFALAEAFLKERQRLRNVANKAIFDKLAKLSARRKPAAGIRIDPARAKKYARKKGKR